MKPISPKQHGVVDYVFAGTALAAPRVLGWSDRVTRFLTGSAVAIVGMSAVTRYELGLVKLLPMKAHIAVDVAHNVLYLAAPRLFRDEDATVKGLVAAMAALGMAVDLLTETESS